MIFCRCTIFRLAKPAFFRYNENFTLGRDFYVTYVVIPEISKNNWQCKVKISTRWKNNEITRFLISGITTYVTWKSRPNVKFSLYLKKAGLASRNIVHLQKNHSTLCRLLLQFSSLHTLSRLDHYWSNVHLRDHRSGCLLKRFIFMLPLT